MRRWMASLAVVGFTAILFGVLIPRSLRQNLLVADSDVPRLERDSLTAIQEVFPATAKPKPVIHRNYQATAPLDNIEVPQLSDDAPLQDSEESEEVVPATGNRFDRGRLNEEFDGEELGHSQNAVAQADRPRVPSPAAPNFTDVGFEEVLRTPPRPKVPVKSTAKADRNFIEQYAPDLVGATRVAPNAAVPVLKIPRVTLVLTQDHQIRIVPENKASAAVQSAVVAGETLITAEEFALVPPTESAGANQLSCTGNVQIRSSQFAGQGSKLMFLKDLIVLEGTAQQPAAIMKLANVMNNGTPAADQGEFRLSARKISFTLPLDKVQVDDAVTISPTPPSTPSVAPPSLPPTAPETTPVLPKEPQPAIDDNPFSLPPPALESPQKPPVPAEDPSIEAESPKPTLPEVPSPD